MHFMCNMTTGSKPRSLVNEHFDLCSLIIQCCSSMPISAKGYYVENIAEVALNLSKDAKRLQENKIIDLFSILMGCF